MTREPIKLLFPCHEKWEDFEGDDRRRFCLSCSKHVHHLSEMTRPEVLELLDKRRPEGVCVRFRQDGRGRVLMRSERRPGRLVWKLLRPVDAPSEVAATSMPSGSMDR